MKCLHKTSQSVIIESLPSWERGLKCSRHYLTARTERVAPLVGAWIEIPDGRLQRPELLSLPSWERGLKYSLIPPRNNNGLVAPLVGAWIEIAKGGKLLKVNKVAPLVGAWIEIDTYAKKALELLSLPSWERGLKSVVTDDEEDESRRSPRGSVD